MLLSTKDQGLGRRRRSYSHSSVYSNNRARPSKLSLLSAITTQSSGSNGSNSTVTQESYNKSKAEATAKKKRSKRKKDMPEARTALMEAVDEENMESAVQPEKLDVFAFLVEEEAGASKDTPVFDEVEQDQDPSSHSLHSDSGISMNGGCVLGQATPTPLLPMLQEEQRPVTSSDASTLLKSHWKWPEVPRPSHWTDPTFNQQCVPPSALEARRDSGHCIADHSPVCYTPATPEYTRTPPSGLYELLVCGESDKGSGLPFLPLRRFKAADERVLVHLQDEICQLDHELKELDAAIAANKSSDPVAVSGRRPSWQWSQPHLYSARTDVLQRLQVKLEAYYKYIILSRKLDHLRKHSIPASEEAQRLRNILKGGLPQGHPSLDFFNVEDLLDLRSWNEESSAGCCVLHALLIFITTIIPLLLFKVFTSLLNRALVISVTLFVGLCMMEKLDMFKGVAGFHFRGSGQDRKELRMWLLVGSATSIVMGLVD